VSSLRFFGVKISEYSRHIVFNFFGIKTSAFDWLVVVVDNSAFMGYSSFDNNRRNRIFILRERI